MDLDDEIPFQNLASLTEDETRHLRALKLFWEAEGRADLVNLADEASPEIVRLVIAMYHAWLEQPEAFGRLAIDIYLQWLKQENPEAFGAYLWN